MPIEWAKVLSLLVEGLKPIKDLSSNHYIPKDFVVRLQRLESNTAEINAAIEAADEDKSYALVRSILADISLSEDRLEYYTSNVKDSESKAKLEEDLCLISTSKKRLEKLIKDKNKKRKKIVLD